MPAIKRYKPTAMLRDLGQIRIIIPAITAKMPEIAKLNRTIFY